MLAEPTYARRGEPSERVESATHVLTWTGGRVTVGWVTVGRVTVGWLTVGRVTVGGGALLEDEPQPASAPSAIEAATVATGRVHTLCT